MSGERILFVTGRLAAPALHAVLERTELPAPHEVAVMRITVAALMTADWIAKRLEVGEEVARVVVPGLVGGDLDALAQRLGVPVERGPADLQELPRWFGQEEVRRALGPRDVRVFAEINHVPHLDRAQLLARAERLREQGADVIDLGLSLDRSWLEEGPGAIAALRERGHRLSIDTLDPEHIRMADAAGVDYVLSLHPGTLALAAELRATPVLIPSDPDDPGALDELDAAIARLEALGRPFLVDPILSPINAGFAASLGRYMELRRRHPDAEVLMGIGNLTELTEADSSGVTALLVGFCQELGIRNVLTTAVIGWACGAVREAVLAAQVMHLAQQQGRPPKHVGGGLVTARDEDDRAADEAELRELQARLRDPNIRLYAGREHLYALSGERFVRGETLFEVFDQLGVEDPTHAFYLGKELMKATIARGLGKAYRQEGPLDWGYLSFPEPRRAGPRPRRRRAGAPAPRPRQEQQ